MIKFTPLQFDVTEQIGEKAGVKDGVKDGTKEYISNNDIDKEIEEKILAIVSNKPEIIQTKIAEEIDVSTRTINGIFKILTEHGVIVRKGGHKSGHWEIVDKK